MSKHILRYGTNGDSKYVSKFFQKNHYDMLAINGNMVAYTPGAIAKFIVTYTREKASFFIDPITHSFQHDTKFIKSYSQKEKNYTIKSSIKKIIEAYGEPITDIILNRDQSIAPHHFSPEIIDSFTRNVIDFQNNTIIKNLKEGGFLDYLEYCEDIEKEIASLKPEFLIPPYFYLDSRTYEEWMKLNIEFINSALTQYPEKDIRAQLVMSKDILNSEDDRTFIVDKYSKTGVKGVLLWIDAFDEIESGDRQLSNFLKLIKSFNDNGISVINLYRGYFSTLLTGFYKDLGFSLEGVSHGLEYGESRAVVPVGGGIPTSKYYYPQLHNRVNYNTAFQILLGFGYFSIDKKDASKKYYNEICDCPKCNSLIEDDINNFRKFENTDFYDVTIHGIKQRRSKPTKKEKEACLFHYLYNKTIEFKKVNYDGFSYEDLITMFSRDIQKFENNEKIDYEDFIHIKVWQRVLNKFKEVNI